MKKVILISIMAVVLMLSACVPTPVVGSPSPSASASPTPSTPTPTVSMAVLSVADYLPLTANVIMTYNGIGNEFAAFVTHVDYINNGAVQIRSNNGGTETVDVYKIDGGALTKIFTQPETYYMYDYTALNVGSDVQVMEPIAVGTTWTIPSGEQRSITNTNATVAVPYGTFQALEVTTTYADSLVKDYYVVDVGLVKTEFTTNSDPANPITSELATVTTSGALFQNARFYYPDFNNDQLAYVDKSLQFNTGDALEAKFEAEFKNVPTGSGLTPLISQATTINSLTFDLNTGVVLVDFSESFISDMNAGTSLEGMLLESVADTLGSYFQTDKVQITIDGGPYESGHILFGTGDYLTFDPNSAVAYP